jgi:hypothetical protein
VTVTHGTNEVLGLDPSRIVDIPRRLSQTRKNVMPPLWDGQAGQRSAVAVERFLSA